MDIQHLALLIPIISVILVFSTAMLAIYLGYRKRKEIFTLYHQERMAALEKGMELPPLPEGLFAEDRFKPSSRRELRKGLVWLFLGLALMVALYANGKTKESLYGLIPTAMGLAYLLYFSIEGKRQPEAGNPAETTPLNPPQQERIPPTLGNR